MRTFRPFLLLCLAAVLSGCFQTKALIRLNADGSGTIEETVLMNSMMAMSIGGGGGDLFGPGNVGGPEMAEDGPYSLAQLQTRAEAMGATFVGVEPVEITFGSGYTATYAFTDINQLQFGSNPLEDMGGLMGGMGQGEASGDEPITFAFSRGRLTVRMPEPQFDGNMDDDDIEVDYIEADEDIDIIGDGEIIDEPADYPRRDSKKSIGDGEIMDVHPEDVYTGDVYTEDVYIDEDSSEDEMQEMAIFLKDMRFSIAVELPAEVRETNASHASGRMLTLYDMDFGVLVERPGLFEELEAMGMSGPPGASMGAMEVFQNIPGFTYEPESEITVSF